MKLPLILICFLVLSCGSNKVKTETKTEISKYPTIGYLEKLSPEFSKYVPENTKIEIIATGHNWTEGPVWLPKEACLIYSDVPKNIAYRWTEKEGSKIYLEPSGYSGEAPRKGGKGSNGLTLDNQGNLMLCRSGDREIATMDASLNNPMPKYNTIASHFKGKRFNSPNDLVLDKKGNIYITDPNYGLPRDQIKELKEISFQGVYRIDKKGEVKLLSSSWPTPNGIGLSPDNKTLYLANTEPPKLVAFNLSETGDVSNERVIFDATELCKKSISKQQPDGMAINKEGVIFMTGPDGILVLTPEGKHLGSIKTDKRTSNCTFNEDETVLYVTCDDLVLRVLLDI